MAKAILRLLLCLAALFLILAILHSFGKSNSISTSTSVTTNLISSVNSAPKEDTSEIATTPNGLEQLFGFVLSLKQTFATFYRMLKPLFNPFFIFDNLGEDLEAVGGVFDLIILLLLMLGLIYLRLEQRILN